MHRFTIDYTDGYVKIENTFVDGDLLNSTNEKHFCLKTYFVKEKVKKYLRTHPDKLGITCTLEEIETSSEQQLISFNECQLSHWTIPVFVRYFIPYVVEIYYNQQIVMTDKLDCKFKLVNFTLNPKDDRELYVWLNVIEKFKKEMNCSISVKNDTVFSTTEFDNIVDVKYKSNDKNNQYYLGLFVGRYYQQNRPDYSYHPDGLHNKNSLDIINDILYYNTKII